MTKFVERITILKEESGLNWKRMSDKCGFSKSNFCYWARSGNLPSGYCLTQIANAFDVSVDWLLGLSEERNTMQANTVEEIRGTTAVGEWVKVHGFCTPGGDPVWKCSNCGKGVHVYGVEHGSYGADIADHQWVACPNCGAVMIGERYE